MIKEDKNNNHFDETNIKEYHLVKETYEHLVTFIINQDKCIHTWTKYLITIQSSFIIGFISILSYLKTNNLEALEEKIALFGLYIIPVLGIVTLIIITNIIVREKNGTRGLQKN